MTTTHVWRKSSYSGAENLCVELAALPAELGIRDGKNPERGHLSLSGRRAAAFLARVKSGR